MLKVQTRQWTCNKRVSCNCGVVLRDHNDVIEFNCCNGLLNGGETTPIRVKIRSNKCLFPGISIKSQLGGTSVKYQVGFVMRIMMTM